MKRILLLLLLSSVGYCAAAGNPLVNDLSLKSFNALFKNAHNVVWSAGKDFSDVSFQEDNILMRARFDNGGNLVQTIRYYKEQNLPVFIMQQIKKEYKGCEIYGVTELSRKDAFIYTFSLRDKKHLFVVLTDINGVVLSSKQYNCGM
ncbi:hypothetical protein [Niabella soli]|uniref:Beta-lactamase-inhibitor-like PepSY-like domain-containing protein n=1 Tax=Niabella soli DSM 19437 TaxID=929713 RepID=W0F2V9_9BACT|nr:hypothetical protein [Niabella soli]AHF16133.1 hypothetical protein NIASO_15215 [Niabella soli DSM 19437]